MGWGQASVIPVKRRNIISTPPDVDCVASPVVVPADQSIGSPKEDPLEGEKTHPNALLKNPGTKTDQRYAGADNWLDPTFLEQSLADTIQEPEVPVLEFAEDDTHLNLFSHSLS